MFLDKLKASVFHLLISILLVAFVIGLLLFLFFPKIFLGISDFKEIAIIVITVDLILGPLLTFVVYKKNKNTLTFDLSVIAAIQLSALMYGGYALFQAHPVYITFNIDRFSIVTAKDADPEKARYEEFNISKLSTAKLAYAKMPNDINKKNELLIRAAMGGQDLDQRVEYYESYEKNKKEILSKGINLDLIISKAKLDDKINKFIKNNKDDISNFVFLPINTAKKDAIIVLDKTSALPVDTINSDPWEIVKK